MLSSFLPPQHDDQKAPISRPALQTEKEKTRNAARGCARATATARGRWRCPSDNVKALPIRSHPEAPAPASRQARPRSAAAPPSASRRPTHRARPADARIFVRPDRFAFLNAPSFTIYPHSSFSRRRVRAMLDAPAALRRPPRSRRTRAAFGRPPAGSGPPPSSSCRGA